MIDISSAGTDKIPYITPSVAGKMGFGSRY